MGPSTLIDGQADLDAAPAPGLEASMGPSTLIDGQARSACCASSSRGSRFNGAVDSHRRTAVRRLLMGNLPTGFNGAVDSHRRTAVIGGWSGGPGAVLQWGRR